MRRTKRIWMTTALAFLLTTSSAVLLLQEAHAYPTYDDEGELETVYRPKLDKLDHLDYDTVFRRATENSENLNLLRLKSKALSEKRGDLQEQMDQMQKGVYQTVTLPTTPDEIKTRYSLPEPDPSAPYLWMGSVAETNAVVNKVMQGQGQMIAALNESMDKSREQLLSQISQSEIERNNTNQQLNDLQVGAGLQVTMQYVQLLSLKEQKQFMTDYLNILQKDIEIANTMLQVGIGTADSVRKAEQALVKQKDDLAAVQRNYQLTLVQLSFDIGIEYDPEISVEAMPLPAVEPAVRQSSDELVDLSNAMIAARDNLKQTRLERDESRPNNGFQQGYKETNIDIAEKRVAQLEIDLRKKIEATYAEAENNYQSLLIAEQNVKDLQTDAYNMNMRLAGGVISARDNEKFQTKVRQTEMMRNLAHLKYAASIQKITAMEQGLIQ